MDSLPGGGHSTQQITMEDSASIKRAADTIRTATISCTCAVNSARFANLSHNDLDALDDEFFDHMPRNVRGPFSVIRELRPLLQVGGDSVIVNLSSVPASKVPNIAYCACKAAIDTMTLSLLGLWDPRYG